MSPYMCIDQFIYLKKGPLQIGMHLFIQCMKKQELEKMQA